MIIIGDSFVADIVLPCTKVICYPGVTTHELVTLYSDCEFNETVVYCVGYNDLVNGQCTHDELFGEYG